MNKIVFRILLTIYAIAILAVSSIPGGALPHIDILSFDKILHIIEYSILAFLAVNAIKTPSTRMILLIIVVGSFYGGLNEIWQTLVADRFASIYDAIANVIGMVIGSIISVKFLLLTHD
ncbi:MAG: hypothetical protein GWP19_08625 [Planctomycetia bacterium]|nr:hypothetical protein [Planctomycetia bacterium]